MKNGSFNKDIEEEKTVKNLIQKFNIQCCIETGTYTGCTTEWFAKLLKQVFTVEITDKWYSYSLNKFKDKDNIDITKMSSEKWLEVLLPKIKEKYKTPLFYLDAHWDNYWPLLNEINIIAKNYNDDDKGFIIIIDDFKVPNRKFQFDNYNNQPNDIEFVKESLSKLKEHIYFYKNRSSSYHESLRPGTIGVGKLYIVSKNLFDINNLKEEEIYTIENGEKYNL
tara:strand:- start:5101 stop:5769 length:669 start_codon:yes stop_codon:yes gene_type:complete